MNRTRRRGRYDITYATAADGSRLVSVRDTEHGTTSQAVPRARWDALVRDYGAIDAASKLIALTLLQEERRVAMGEEA